MHILPAEEHPTKQKLALRLQERLGCRPDFAANGYEAHDFVLLDIMMLVMDGHEVLEIMKGKNSLRDIPVIVISAVVEVDSAVRCIKMGAEDYLPKPFNPVSLKARLDASLRRKKLRDLEQVYSRQEITLRRSEKLATMGRLSAGMAHG